MDRALKSFLTVAELGSFSAAADTLAITQPALTKRIQQLESEFKCELFIRQSRGVILSDSGRKMLRFAKRIQSNYLQAHEALRSDELQEVRIASGPLFQFLHMSTALAGISRLFPQVKLIFETAQEGVKNLERLRNKEIDILFGGKTEVHKIDKDFEFEFIPLLEVELGVLLAKQTATTFSKALDAGDFSAFSWVSYSGTPDYGVMLQGFFLNQGVVPPDPVLTTASLSVGIQFVAETNSFMVVPEHLITAFTDKEVSFLPTKTPIGNVVSGAFLRKSSQNYDFFKVFLGEMRKSVSRVHGLL